MSQKLYEVEVRRYAEDADDVHYEGFDSIVAAHDHISRQSAFGPFRCWVNNNEVKRAYHGVTLETILTTITPDWADMAYCRPFATNPATLLTTEAL